MIDALEDMPMAKEKREIAKILNSLEISEPLTASGLDRDKHSEQHGLNLYHLPYHYDTVLVPP